jgi:hypothetical protein
MFIKAEPINLCNLDHALIRVNGRWYEAKRDIQSKTWKTVNGFALTDPDYFFPIPDVPKYENKRQNSI